MKVVNIVVKVDVIGAYTINFCSFPDGTGYIARGTTDLIRGIGKETKADGETCD